MSISLQLHIEDESDLEVHGKTQGSVALLDIRDAAGTELTIFFDEDVVGNLERFESAVAAAKARYLHNQAAP